MEERNVVLKKDSSLSLTILIDSFKITEYFFFIILGS